ncbi:MAG: hypothetical protein CMF70_06940 [Magnetovibrio sp.]|nr:hypothetical protein [Magnetovibrio sp.]
MVLFIDVGHGGKNQGCSVGLECEKDYLLKFCKDLERFLSPLFEEVKLCRSVDKYLTLGERGKMSKAAGADLVLVIHVNAHHRADVSGLLAFNADKRGEFIGNAIMKAAPKPLRMKRGSVTAKPEGWTKQAYNVLAPHDHTTAVLVELFFSTNKQDLVIGQSGIGKKALFSAILQGICAKEVDDMINGRRQHDPTSAFCDWPEAGGSIRG